MELDLSSARAFVATAEELTFGRAAKRLFLTQQAVSKRIARLENILATPLLVRGPRTVELTEAGRRFLPLARAALDAADAALAELQQPTAPLHLDVLDERLAPMVLVRRLLHRQPDLHVRLSTSHGLEAALSALERGELHAAFGRIRDFGRPWPSALAHRIVRFEPLMALLRADHPLARRAQLTMSELRDVGLWAPESAVGATAEWDAYLREFVDAFDLSVTFRGAAHSMEHQLDLISREQEHVALTGADIALPQDAGVACLPLVDPTPLYPWSLTWRKRDRHPLLPQLLTSLTRIGHTSRRPDRRHHWLPAQAT